MSIISVSNLSKVYKYYKKSEGLNASVKSFFNRKTLYKKAVDNISFSIEQGEIVGFIGPNGAGKTTTMKMLSGILHPTSGVINVLGYEPKEQNNELKRQFSIVMGQKNQLWWDLPANESFRLNKYIYDLEDKQYRKNLDELCELLEIKELLDVQVRKLSLGERMKMELVASLLHNPKVLYLDEPTIGLDFVSQKKLRDFLKYYNVQSKITILLTSHYINDIEDLCKRSIIINHGSIVYDGSLDKINQDYNSKKIIKLKFSKEIKQDMLYEYGQVNDFNGFDAEIEVPRNIANDISRNLLSNLPILDFTIEDIPLEKAISLLY